MGGSTSAYCPHCGHPAILAESSVFGKKCANCGGPRVPIADREIVLSGKEREPLLRARRLRQAQLAWWTIGGLLILFGVVGATVGSIVALIMLAAGTLGLVNGLLLTGVTLTPFVVAALAFRAAWRQGKQIPDLIDLAAAHAVGALMAQRNLVLTSLDLARLLDLSEDRAEKMLAFMNVEDLVVSNVTDAGEITYASPRAALRARVAIEDAELEEASNGVAAADPLRQRR